ncbi:LysR family transcriptional regulator [Pygmaiobacter massiliensis]|uniref:LysR family transcriptional regulator n=1 Tax=Pygmaiobacter massiliensis TaxID=1917873 RepID=UPI0015E10D74|nr:LysR family transcriptional regulator [Pygmaiobacter massiliensis]
MTFSQLQYVVEISRTKSIYKAAQNLFISHSVVSSAIRNLEKELGQPIFYRSNKGVTPTAFGVLFIDHILPIKLSLDQLDGFLQDSGQQTFCVASMGFPFVTAICADLIKQYKEQRLSIRQFEEYAQSIPTLVAERQATIGILRIWSCYMPSLQQQFRAQEIELHPLATLEVGITVGHLNPLFYKAEDFVYAHELKNYTALMYTSDDIGPYADVFNKLNMPHLHSKFSTSSRAAIFELLDTTDAFYINSMNYPEEGTNPNTSSHRRTLKLKDCPISSQIIWIKRKDHLTNEVEKNFLNEIKLYFRI